MEKNKLGLPKEKKYAEDRAPTIEEIQKLLEYPDRRIKVINIDNDILWNATWSMECSSV
jgi:hypothetical protein